MTLRQRIISYSIVIFLMVWGLDLINVVKFNLSFSWKDLFSPFRFSQIIYCLCAFILCRLFLQRILPQRKYILILPAIFLLIVNFILIRYTIEEGLYPLLFQIRNYNPGTNFTYYALDNIYYALIYISLGTLLYLLDAQIAQQKMQAELQQRNREAELQLLRSQIHPHFLFNTLNNIYSLVYEKSPHAPRAMLQLSELMRYLLYEKKEEVELAKEWEYIRHFISLQQMRFDFPIAIKEELQGDWKNWKIPPYLLIPFIENAFKHGDFQKGPLEMSLSAEKERLQLDIRNPVGYQQKDNFGGIGLDNVKRRLELLYPNQHQLKIISNRDYFTVSLELKKSLRNL